MYIIEDFHKKYYKKVFVYMSHNTFFGMVMQVEFSSLLEAQVLPTDNLVISDTDRLPIKLLWWEYFPTTYE